MFAYCNNNPINCIDTSGCLSASVGPNAMLYDGGGRKNVIIPDDKYSKTTEMINGQGVFEFADEPMGIGTYSDNGCGIVAVYNAMQLLGEHQALGSIEDDFLLMNGMLLCGLWGVAPWSIGDYFASQGIAYTGYLSFEGLANNVSEGDVIVFMVMNNVNNIFAGFHYMSAQYVSGGFVVYNMYTNSTTSKLVQSLDPVYGSSGWTYGYIVGG